MVKALVDADILIDLLRQNPLAVNWLNVLGKTKLGVVSIAWMEVAQGATDKIKRTQAIKFLKDFTLVHFESQDSQWATYQFTQYHLSHGIGITDTIIAAVAVRLDAILYTRNLKHYAILPGLKIQQPY